MRNKHLHARIHAFTLVEMLVAIGILAMIAVLGWRGLDSMVRSRVALADAMQQTRSLQRVFAQLQDDCAHLADTANIGRRLPLRITPGRLLLVRNVFTEREATRLQAVSYRVQDGVLLRRESPPTRDLAALETFLGGAPGNATDMPLQAGVRAMTLRSWSGGGWGDSAAPGTPASGLEVTLQFSASGNRIQRLFLLGAA